MICRIEGVSADLQTTVMFTIEMIDEEVLGGSIARGAQFHTTIHAQSLKKIRREERGKLVEKACKVAFEL